MKNETFQTQSTPTIVFTFAGLTLSVTAFLVGSNVGMNLPLSLGILVIIIGNIILALYSGFIGVIGQSTRKPSIMISKPAFGSYGQIITSTIVVIFLMGFVAVYSSMIGTLIHTMFPQVPALAGNLAFIICITLTTVSGFKGMSLLSKIGLPCLFVFVLYGLYQVNAQIGLSAVLEKTPVSSLGMGLIISQVISVWTAAATFSSDMTRFAKRRKDVFIITFLAFACTAVLESVGLICALGTGKGDLVAILQGLDIMAVALLIYLLLMWTSAQSLLYSFSLAFQDIAGVVTKGRSKASREVWVIVGGVVAFAGSVVMTLYGLTSSFNAFLLTVGIAIPSIGGILIAHYFVVQRNFETAFDNIPNVRVVAFVSWLAGIVVAKFVGWGIPAINGLITAAVLYSILGLAAKARAEKS